MRRSILVTATPSFPVFLCDKPDSRIAAVLLLFRATIEADMKEHAPPHRRNPKTEAAHRRETRWQITLPLVAGAVLLLVLAVLAGMTPAPQAGKWADTALIFLIALSFVPLFVALVLGAALAYGVWKGNQALPSVMLRGQEIAEQVNRSVRKVSDKITAPVIRGRVLGARLRAAKRRIGRLKEPEKG